MGAVFHQHSKETDFFVLLDYVRKRSWYAHKATSIRCLWQSVTRQQQLSHSNEQWPSLCPRMWCQLLKPATGSRTLRFFLSNTFSLGELKKYNPFLSLMSFVGFSLWNLYWAWALLHKLWFSLMKRATIFFFFFSSWSNLLSKSWYALTWSWRSEHSWNATLKWGPRYF